MSSFAFIVEGYIYSLQNSGLVVIFFKCSKASFFVFYVLLFLLRSQLSVLDLFLLKYYVPPTILAAFKIFVFFFGLLHFSSVT